MGQTTTIKALVSRWGVQIESTSTDTNPSAPDWKDANHYRVTLRTRTPRRQLSTYFSQGYGITGDPTASGVLSCLVSDAAGVDNARSFEEWASDYGFDADSRKAERTFKACQEQARKLRAFLGTERYTEITSAEQD
jgi:hypothetical protein